MINNSAYNSDQPYYVLTTDYLAKGGDNMEFFKYATEYINTGVLLRDAIINYISEINKTGIKEEAKFDGRIKINLYNAIYYMYLLRCVSIAINK